MSVPSDKPLMSPEPVTECKSNPSSPAPPKSTISFTPVKKPRLRRRDALKRGPALHPIEEDDLKFYWGAYRRGAFDIPEGLTTEEFTDRINRLAQIKLVFTLIAGEPVGMVTIDNFYGMGWPDVVWFPWVKPRKILEASVYALQEGMRDTNLMFIIDDDRFARHMTRYGLLIKDGRLSDRRKIYERRKW